MWGDGELAVDELLGHFGTFGEAFAAVPVAVSEYVDELVGDGRVRVLDVAGPVPVAVGAGRRRYSAGGRQM